MREDLARRLVRILEDLNSKKIAFPQEKAIKLIKQNEIIEHLCKAYKDDHDMSEFSENKEIIMKQIESASRDEDTINMVDKNGFELLILYIYAEYDGK